ncbi:hypothetical protein FHS43_000294 [Streptosporangium becharense]|uniref:Uncharacterized protein n=1 Tax=Streptosporangium becharense TaxID=1816182 RepID=A0A7W9IFT1_9ACTN|nr:hypothetical protein [Streptosporangium becharense]MBB5819934.1 hypothetical protein [Streptosporangium becharense]
MTSVNAWKPESGATAALPTLAKHTDMQSYARARVEMGEEA